MYLSNQSDLLLSKENSQFNMIVWFRKNIIFIKSLSKKMRLIERNICSRRNLLRLFEVSVVQLIKEACSSLDVFFRQWKKLNLK